MMVFGDLPPLRHSKYGVRFAKQFSMVFGRQLTLRLRDKWLFFGDLGTAFAKAILLALAYADISSKSAPVQTGFFFFILMACSIDGLKTMPKVISERTIMKMETSEALYSDWAYILSFSVISTMFLGALWPCLGYSWNLFQHVWLWTMLVYIVMDSLYLMLSGIAKDAAIAQMLSLPFLLIFLLYNGYTVTVCNCPAWLQWVIHLSPVAYAMEAITVAAARICSNEPCGKDQLYPSIVQHFGYKEQIGVGIAVACTCLVIFRAIHMICLKCLNNIQR